MKYIYDKELKTPNSLTCTLIGPVELSHEDWNLLYHLVYFLPTIRRYAYKMDQNVALLYGKVNNSREIQNTLKPGSTLNVCMARSRMDATRLFSNIRI